MKTNGIFIFIISNFIISVFIVTGCDGRKKGTFVRETDTIGQQIGSVMADMDENGSASGSYATLLGEQKMFARYFPMTWYERIQTSFVPRAGAAACTNTYSSCVSNVITRDFDDCMVGTYKFSGTVTLTFTDAAVNSTCLLTANNDKIARIPDYQILGSRGGVFTVHKVGSRGQVVTVSNYAAKEFKYSNDGIRRTVTYNGTTLASYTTETTADITLTGAIRNGRVAHGGVLKVTNDLTSQTCEFSPNNLTWDSSCNCPVSGWWSGTCFGQMANLRIQSCNTGVYVQSDTVIAVIFDRCFLQ